MVADVDVTIRIPLHGAASGSVSGALGTDSSFGDGVCNGIEEGSNDGSGLHLKVAHPFIEGGDVGLRPVNVLDDSDLDRDLNPGHGYACDQSSCTGTSLRSGRATSTRSSSFFCRGSIKDRVIRLQQFSLCT